MTDTDEPQYRAHYQPDPADVSVRELGEDEDGTFAVRMPIASTGEVRNEGDDPLTRDELAGMARQINERDAGVFLAHGTSGEITDSRYGQTERLGSWADADVQDGADRDTDDGDAADLLFADAVMADPETLPAATGSYREALAILKEQAKRDIPLSASIGWRDDRDAPGGNDLMEASIVGIPADPRTFTQGADPGVMARAAVAAGADREAFLSEVRAAVMGGSSDAQHDMTERAPEDIGPAEFYEFVASHWDGADAADVNDALDDVGEYAGAVDVPELAAFVGNVVDEDTGAVQDQFDEWMSESDSDQSADDADDTNREEQDGTDGAEEFREFMREQTEKQTEILQSLSEALREDDEDEDEEENEGDHDDEDDEDENSADEPDEEQDAPTPEEKQEALATLRDGGVDVSDLDLPDPDAEQDADAEDDEESAETEEREAGSYDKYGLKRT